MTKQELISKLKETLKNAKELPCLDCLWCNLYDKCNDEVIENKDGNGCMWREIQRALKILEDEEKNEQ